MVDHLKLPFKKRLYNPAKELVTPIIHEPMVIDSIPSRMWKILGFVAHRVYNRTASVFQIQKPIGKINLLKFKVLVRES